MTTRTKERSEVIGALRRLSGRRLTGPQRRRLLELVDPDGECSPGQRVAVVNWVEGGARGLAELLGGAPRSLTAAARQRPASEVVARPGGEAERRRLLGEIARRCAAPERRRLGREALLRFGTQLAGLEAGRAAERERAREAERARGEFVLAWMPEVERNRRDLARRTYFKDAP